MIEILAGLLMIVIGVLLVTDRFSLLARCAPEVPADVLMPSACAAQRRACRRGARACQVPL